MEHIEIEFKMLLNEKLFHQILKDYKEQITDSYQQTNYYLFHPELEKRKYLYQRLTMWRLFNDNSS